jgi:ketopantoate reductase
MAAGPESSVRTMACAVPLPKLDTTSFIAPLTLKTTVKRDLERGRATEVEEIAGHALCSAISPVATA